MSTSFENRKAHAHHLGKDRARHLEAAGLLSDLAHEATDPATKCECIQQAGVYLANAGDHVGARALYQVARQYAQTDTACSNIDRDDARSAATIGHYGQALDLVTRAISRRDDTQLERYVDIGFRGRIKCQQARQHMDGEVLEEGLVDMRVANAVLRDKTLNPDRNLELYNLLHLASGESLASHRLRSRRLALRALRLMAFGRLSRHQVGNREHIVRAVLLLAGGWRLEEMGRKLRKPK